MFEKIYRILEEILGASRQGDYNKDTDQYQFNCPCCAEENGGKPDNKYNLEVNLKLGKYNCWKCGDTDGTKGNIRYLVKKYGTPLLYKRYKDEITFLIKSKMYDINLFSAKKEEEDETFITLPRTFSKIDLSNCPDTLRKYLEKRKIDQSIIDKFNIGYTSWNEYERMMRNRIIIPSYDEYGDLNYWVGRDFTGAQKIKYKNCNSDKKKIIFQESHINWDFDIILCEGAIDCLYPVNAISMLGKKLTKDTALFGSLTKRANGNIIIVLDSDTDITETKRIYSLLNFGRLKNKIWYVRMEKYKDIGEVYENEGKKGIINTIKNKLQFKEYELVF